MLYLIGGENLYKSSRRLGELKKEFVSRHDGLVQIYEADELNDYQDIVSDTDNISLFGKKKLTIVKRLMSSRSSVQEDIYDYIKSSRKLNLIFWEDRRLDKRRSIYKILKKKGVVEEFNYLKYYQLKSWLSRYLSKHIDYEGECIDELIYKIGDDQFQLVSVSRNLIYFVLSDNRKKLRLVDVQNFVAKTTEESIWEFIDALGEYDKKRTLEIAESIYSENDDFVKIIGMLARQFRIIAMIKYLVGLKKDSREIAKVLELHPFVVKKALDHSRNFSFEKIRKVYDKLMKTDLVVKQGRFEGKLALGLFIAAL